MHQDTVMGEHSILTAFSQRPPSRCSGRCGNRPYAACAALYRLVEGFLTLLPAEHPRQTPLFILPRVCIKRRRRPKTQLALGMNPRWDTRALQDLQDISRTSPHTLHLSGPGQACYRISKTLNHEGM